MKIGSFGRAANGWHEEPKFNGPFFQVGTAALSAQTAPRRRAICHAGKFFSGAKNRAPKVAHQRGTLDQLRASIKTMNEWAPAGGMAFAVIGAIVLDQCRTAQMASNITNLKELMAGNVKDAKERFDKIDAKLEKLDKIEAKIEKLDAKIDKIAIISFGSYGFAYLLYKINEARGNR